MIKVTVGNNVCLLYTSCQWPDVSLGVDIRLFIFEDILLRRRFQ